MFNWRWEIAWFRFLIRYFVLFQERLCTVKPCLQTLLWKETWIEQTPTLGFSARMDLTTRNRPLVSTVREPATIHSLCFYQIGFQNCQQCQDVDNIVVNICWARNQSRCVYFGADTLLENWEKYDDSSVLDTVWESDIFSSQTDIFNLIYGCPNWPIQKLSKDNSDFSTLNYPDSWWEGENRKLKKTIKSCFPTPFPLKSQRLFHVFQVLGSYIIMSFRSATYDERRED